ncbi:MAG: L-2-hydroxyglutarate oxidase [SAR324 cluster bacterium]|nr:L-2-hydroxyglutarate oxidase [SAR324 cluster bacterium]MCZ6646939.1 L-2-hydroxyglutarate oxidase [SAR324 cluster bacterium]
MTTCDFLVIGGGVIGLNIARELRRKFGGAKVVLIEKETALGLHASGRNSGVLHAGFYYSADSLKAKFTRLGNQALTEYCESKGIPLNKCGKLVVAKNEAELPVLDELYKRGKVNGVPLDSISEAEAKEIEPRVKTCQRALFSPTTSSVDPGEVMEAMRGDALAEGVELHPGVAYLGHSNGSVATSDGPYQPGYLVNAAGLYADKIARDYGFSERYRILPFKGLYLYSEEPPGALRTNIYPVPDLRNPFLGVHFTVTAAGKAKIGPTAIPAFWREQYEGFGNFSASELLDILVRQAGLFVFSGFGFQRMAVEELRKYYRPHLVALSSELLEGVHSSDYKHWGKAGIRAQLLDLKSRKLEMDFVFEHDERSMHVLNAVSPGFTCSIPFSQYICDHIG